MSQSAGGPIEIDTPNPCTMTVDFGNVRLTQQASATLAITNQSNTDVTLRPNTTTLETELRATFTDPQPQTLAAGSSTQLTVVFQANAVGAVQSTFAVLTDAPAEACGSAGSSVITITLAANAVDFTLVSDPPLIDFGTTPVGGSVVKAITLTNTTAVPIAGIDSSIAGGSPADFTVSGVPSWLAAGASASVQVTYAPLAVKPSSSATVTFTGGEGESAVSTLLGEPVSSGLVLSPATLTFGYVVPPATAIACTTLSNQISTAITVSGIIDFATGGGAFSLSPTDGAAPPNPATLPVTLTPGSSAELCFEFAPPMPPSDTQFTGQATIQSNDASGVGLKLPLAGWGGGPVLSCTPSSVDFGEVLDNSTASIPVTCTNVGSVIAEADLILQQPAIASSVFSASFDKTINVYPADGLKPGESAQIDVLYAPTLAAHDQGTLVLGSNGGQGTPLQIPVKGQGLKLAPCQYTVTPAALDFGNLMSGDTSVLSFAVQNTGDDNCLLTDVRVADQANGVFSLVSKSIEPDPQTGVITIPPASSGEASSLIVRVSCSPADQGSYSADVLFGITDPINPNQRIPLTGTSEPTCLLVEPSTLDFGTVGTSQLGSPCSGTSRVFSIFNTCAASATVRSLTLQSGEGDSVAQFSLATGATLPLTLPQGGSGVLQIAFQPTTLGAHSARLLISDGTVDTTVGLTGNAIQAPIQTDSFTVAAPTADILLIEEVGNSAAAQLQVGGALSAFLEAAGSVDYRIAVTTDDDQSTFASAEFGHLLPCMGCSVSGTAPTIVSPTSTPTGANKANPGKVLTDLYTSVPNNAFFGPARHYFLALYDALVHAPIPGVDFFRSGAYFAAVADAQKGDDNSSSGPGQHDEDWFESFFQTYFQQSYLFGWDQIEPNAVISGTGLFASGQLPTDIGEMITATNGLGLNLSDPAWSSALLGIWDAAASAAGYYALSSVPPIEPGSITVTVDGIGVPQLTAGQANWTYHPNSNTISFTSNYPLSLGDTIAVSYPIGCQ